MSDYKGNYRVVSKVCDGCKKTKEMPTRNKFCSKKCASDRRVVKTPTEIAKAETSDGPKILLIDIETFPIKAYVWGMYEQNVLSIVENSVICCFSAKWLGGPQVTLALPDFDGYNPKKANDKKLVGAIQDLLNAADIVIAHNGNKFDFKVIATRLMYHRYPVTKPFRKVDTLLLARATAKFPSNNLNAIGQYLEIGEKFKHSGFDLWKNCMAGVDTAWDEMRKYNAQDVVLLEKVYLALRSWSGVTHPNVSMYYTDPDRPTSCGTCGSTKIHSRGPRATNTSITRRWACVDCGAWSHTVKNEKPKGQTTLANG